VEEQSASTRKRPVPLIRWLIYASPHCSIECHAWKTGFLEKTCEIDVKQGANRNEGARERRSRFHRL